MKELISIIVPVYNGERHLSRCLNSLFKQTYQNIEIIIINDGSTDRTAEILRQYKEKAVIFTTENMGVSHARNIGLSNARGDYIAFVDADDELTEDALSILYQNLKKYDADVSVGEKIIVDKKGEVQSQINTDEIKVWADEEIIKLAFDDHFVTWSACGKLYKKTIIENVRFEVGKKINEDAFFVFEIFSFCKRIVYQDYGVYLCHETVGSASRGAFSEKYFDILYFSEKKARIIQEKYPQYVNVIPIIEMRARLSLLYNLCKTYDKKYKTIQKECLKRIKELMLSFKPKTKTEKRFMFIIRFKLFWLYKFYLYRKFNF